MATVPENHNGRQISHHGFREWARCSAKPTASQISASHGISGNCLMREEHPRDIVVGGFQRHVGFQSSDPFGRGTCACRRPVESQWQNHLRIGIENLKAPEGR